MFNRRLFGLLIFLLIYQIYPPVIQANIPDLTLNYVSDTTTAEPVSSSPTLSQFADIDIPKLISLDYGKEVLDDTKYVLISPIRWKTQEWVEASLITLGIIGTAAFLDKPIKDNVQLRRECAPE